MAQRIYKPPFPLSQYVEVIWRAANSGMPSSRQRVYPNGAMALVIHLKQPTASYYFDDRIFSVRVPLLAGPYSISFHVDPSESTEVIGVLFRPGAGRMFFPVAAHELHNNDVPLSELFPGEAERLLNDLCSATGEDAQFLVVEQYLTRKLEDAIPLHPAVRHAIDRLSGDHALLRSVRKIQLDTGFSHTRFIQLFREQVGLTPKLFGRVRRFHALIGRIDKGLPVNWADVAADCGYVDQAHLIHDFREFAGVTPLEYTKQAMLDASQKLLVTATSS
jgi:AraC-like DNA-binding protein